MRVWIDQDLCTGDGLCLDHCPDVFVQLEDGNSIVLNKNGSISIIGDDGREFGLARLLGDEEQRLAIPPRAVRPQPG